MAKRSTSINERHTGYTEAMESLFGTLDLHTLADVTKREGTPANYRWLRRFLFTALDLEENPNPDYYVQTGCILPFRSVLSMLSLFQLLDRLNVSYTFLRENEYCIGLPIMYQAKGEEIEEADALCADLIELNMAQIRQLGVRGIVHFCDSGFAMMQKLHNDPNLELMFYVDFLIEQLKSRQLRLEPTVVGYYRGCWRTRYELNPKLKIDHAAHRALIERIEGVTLVDLPQSICCHENEVGIVEAAESSRVECIVTPCEGCRVGVNRGMLTRPKSRRIPVYMHSDILLQALVD